MIDSFLKLFINFLHFIQILGEVFGFLPLRDLKSVRRVSSSWRDISAPTFRRRSSVKLIGYNGRMARFLQVFATTDSVPFGNYELTWFYDADSEDLLGAFWEKYGASIHNIELYWVNMVGVDFVRDILFNSSPNLKSIGIHFCSFYETFVQRGVGMFHKEIAPLPGNVRVNKSLTTLRYFNGYDTLEHDLPISWEEVFTSYPNLKVTGLLAGLSNSCVSKSIMSLFISCLESEIAQHFFEDELSSGKWEMPENQDTQQFTAAET